MPYGYIVIFGAIALTLYHFFATPASRVSKISILVVLGFCLACRYWLHRFILPAMFILAGLAIYISLHRTVTRARANRRDSL